VYDELTCDVLVLGSGGAGLMAALHAYDANPRLRVVLAAKGLVGKSGCTRMVHGMNAAMDPTDSIERHFRESVRAGRFLNQQELTWLLAEGAPRMVAELECVHGCCFDRGDDGRIEQYPFAGQAVNRGIRRGTYTGVEIVSRLHDQLFARSITLLDEARAVELIHDRRGGRIAGALLLNIRTGTLTLAHARVVVLATGGGPGMYRVTDYSFEKSGDGFAMAYRAGCALRDMEMVHFISMGIVAGTSRLHTLVVEDSLRYAGGHLLNARGERFMAAYEPEAQDKASVEAVARASLTEIVEGRGTASGAVLLDVSHLGAKFLHERFPELVERCADFGYDLTAEPIQVAPSAHFHLGGVKMEADCGTAVEGLLVAGEDAGGVHGAGRIPGNTSIESLVFGARAGETAARLCSQLSAGQPDVDAVMQSAGRVLAPLGRDGPESPFALHAELRNLMWERVGPVRDGMGLTSALEAILDLGERLGSAGAGSDRRWNAAWQEILDLESLLTVARLTTRAALHRTESRGAHYRRDFPAQDDEGWLVSIFQQQSGDLERVWVEPPQLSRLAPAGEGTRT
jgi:succinate dehydrogenase / fumarate reductase flavoprotein subunit/fumarate reductase flavoprotein subunit